MGRKPTKGKRWELIRPGEAAKPEPVSLPPGEQRVKVRLEKRKGGRVMTVLEGLVLTPADLKALAKVLKSHLGTGGGSPGDAIELQGDHREAARTFLREKGYGLR
jgi:translation initiation factor 1